MATPSGPRPIADLGPGDWVLSYDHQTHTVEPQRVLARIENLHPALREVTLVSGVTLRVTAEHPLYDVERQAYVPVGELSAEQLLLQLGTRRGESLALLPIEISALVSLIPEQRGTAEIRAYDLTVEKNHNFFADGVLAHNKSPLRPLPELTPPQEFPTATCSLPLEIAVCQEQGQVTSGRELSVGTDPLFAVSSPLTASVATMPTLAPEGSPNAVPDAGVLAEAGAPRLRDAGVEEIGSDASALAADAGDSGDAGDSDGGDATVSALATVTALIDAASVALPAESHDAGGGFAVDAGPALSASDSGAPQAPWPDFGDQPPAMVTAQSAVLWLEFERCAFVGSTVAYVAKAVLHGPPGSYSFSVWPVQTACVVTAPSLEQTAVIDEQGTAELWLTLPQGGLPWALTARGDAPFEVSLELY